jgi:hypothetical protein
MTFCGLQCNDMDTKPLIREENKPKVDDDDDDGDDSDRTGSWD